MFSVIKDRFTLVILHLNMLGFVNLLKAKTLTLYEHNSICLGILKIDVYRNW